MNYYSQEPLPEDARFSLSSVILLTIFIGAVAVIIYAWIAMPWADDDAPLASGDLGEIAVGEQATENEDGVVAGAEPDEAAFSEGEIALQAE